MSSHTMTGFILVLILYVAATLLFCLRHIFREPRLSLISLRVALIGYLAHLFFLLLHFFALGYPFLLTSFETNQLIGFFILTCFFFLSMFYRFVSAGIFVMPLVVIFSILSLTHAVGVKTPSHFLANPWAFVHLVLTSLGVAIFLMSFVTGLFYLLQEYRIKHKKIGRFWERFPSLEVLDLIHYRGLYVGFIFYTLGIITGGGWSKSISGVYVTSSVKQLTALSVWIFFALFLNLRVSRGWVGRKGILLSLIGFMGLIFLFSWVNR